ncbi:MAG: DUF1223 domain-containing protein [Candidatus Sulfotelmatobacter sp.]
MRNFAIALFRFSLIQITACAAFIGAPLAQTRSATEDRKPVVIELFTSEGCSSCPPADLLLQKLATQQPVAGVEIIALEEHVDYWNRDGWIDPFSSAEWTQRQIDYGAVFKNDAYTPEAVVDGRSQFVGNSPRQAELEIDKAARRAKTEIAIAPAQSDSKSSRFHVSVAKLVGATSGDPAEIWLAVTEDGLQSSVSRGENAGHVLRHIATLRSLHKIGVADANGALVSFTGDPVVKFNPNWNVGRLHVTVFVQQRKSREIIGAASTIIQEIAVNSKQTS